MQTLSRLNRIHPAEGDTFVLDFRNDTEDIVKAFEPYYGGPSRHRPTRTCSATLGVAWTTSTCSPRGGRGRGGRARHDERAEGPREGLRPSPQPSSASARSGRRPAGVQGRPGQVRPHLLVPLPARLVRGHDAGARLHVLPRPRIGDPRSSRRRRIDLGTEVELTALQIEVTFSGTLSLDSEIGEVKTIFGEGRGKRFEAPLEHLSKIIEVLNERFGLNLPRRTSCCSTSSRKAGRATRNSLLKPGTTPSTTSGWCSTRSSCNHRDPDGRQRGHLQADSR